MPESEPKTVAGTSSECQSIVIARERLSAEIRAGEKPRSSVIAGKHLTSPGQLWKQTWAGKNIKATIPYGLTMVFAHLHNLKVCADRTFMHNRSPTRITRLSDRQRVPISRCKQMVLSLRRRNTSA